MPVFASPGHRVALVLMPRRHQEVQRPAVARRGRVTAMHVYDGRCVELGDLLDHGGSSTPYVERRPWQQAVVPHHLGLEAGEDLQVRFALYDAVVVRGGVRADGLLHRWDGERHLEQFGEWGLAAE